MATVSIQRPDPSEYKDYFATYIDLVTEPDVIGLLQAQVPELRKLLESVAPQELEKLHEPYTWTIKQVLGHLIDTERVFGYRAARFATGDSTPLAGFDQDAFVANMNYTKVPLATLLDELDHLRQGHLAMFSRFDQSCWDHVGHADGKPMSTRAAAYIMAGHIRHHQRIVETRLG